MVVLAHIIYEIFLFIKTDGNGCIVSVVGDDQKYRHFMVSIKPILLTDFSDPCNFLSTSSN